MAVLKKTTGKAVFLPALLFFLFSCGAPEVRYERAPSLLPGTDRQMKTAGYWIGRHPAPDRLFLDPSQIERLNRYVAEELKRTRDLLSAPEAFPREDLLPLLEEDAEPFGQGTYYGRDGDEAEPSFLDSLDRNRNMGGLPERIVPRPALVVRFAEQRVFPAADPLYAKRGDLNFDELQMSSLDVGTPLLAVLESLDGAWVYVLDPLYRGWVKKENVAFCTRDEMERYMRPGEFAVVTAAKADLYLDARRTKHHEYARMGVRFPLAGDPGEDGTLPVLLPLRREDGTVSFREGFVSAGAARRGFLPLTPRNMLEQAFRLLDAPYGWGGMYGEQDCSRFVQEIFATAGIDLPRNSSGQAGVGLLLDKFEEDVPAEEKERIITGLAVGGVTLLYMKGHILLYTGQVDGKPYAVHGLWGYRERSLWHDRVRVTGRVVLSDLTLGRGTGKGSLLDRIVSFRVLSPVDLIFTEPEPVPADTGLL
ncbi:MAG TPA: SH3 domain-containing protein [Syntrophales bacterium]|nr:SH3 domain-containing protein [Syntrophales bacterium]HQB30740.1 SH3 domain-containing protein [Syntrophales bacterium]